MPDERHSPHRVLITGATGAIGAALARTYAAPGTQLILHGRRQDILQDIAQQCRAQGAEVRTHEIDLCNEQTLFSWLEGLCDPTPPDLVIANAGMNTDIGEHGEGESWEAVSDLLDINLKVPMAMLNHLGKRMRVRGSGQLVVMSSLAAYHGLALTPSYSASKAGIKAYGEALRGWLATSGVGVTVVMPGYVSSKMCHDMPGPKPFLWQPARAARCIARGIERNQARISFPFPLNLGCWWLAVLPAGISQRVLSWLGYGGNSA
ncbi:MULTISPECIES: SDR family NAD(P)-dependent oxidoreductase [Halomonadaceae]|jgi:short-subunit dehydrogenase|uniref:SDR family NAD(P)-dependent oxidoreductase n=1 Tax=Halomonadaceae TaxID=28256 RepID=UPI001583D238|nr:MULTISPECIES: SDR family NAD(P)-dependent oxidoreductase [Halomonas]MDI4636229.1 SDR family NAD(P)-dependent oxidoreductase [Halomonas sp. BMC7]NUJ60592.1 SDR family NAD(P)-dependent oxidoreductase [Halomonas taeanensis]